MKQSTSAQVKWIMGLILACLCATTQAQRLTLPLTGMEEGLTVYFISPDGSGNLDGQSETNALPFSQLEPFIRDLKTSARVVLLPGEYALDTTLDLVTAADRVLVVEGRDGTVIKGNFDPVTRAGISSGMRLHSGNIIVRGLTFKQTGYCVKADKNFAIDQVLIENIVGENNFACVLVDRDTTLPVTRLIVRNAQISGYYRNGIRLAGPQSANMLIENVHVDGANDFAKNDCYKSGIQLLAGVSDVHLYKVSVKNNIGDCGEDYQQGDGIEADHKEGVPRNIRLEKVSIANSRDADLDLKAANVSMYRVVSLGGPETRYAFKLWEYDYTCNQCYAFGANTAFIHLVQADLAFRSSILSSDKPVHVCDLRHGTTPEQQASVRFEDAQIYLANEEWINECGEGALASVKRLPMGRIAPPHPPEF